MPIERSWQERLSAWVPSLRQLDAWNEMLYAQRARYAAATACWQQPIVLGDRSLVTSYATRWRKWGSPHACIRRVDRLEAQVPAPDHVVLLDVDPELAWSRTQARRRTYGQYDESLPRLREAREAYYQIATYGVPRLQHTQWHVLDGNQSPQKVLRAWLQLMKQLVTPSYLTSTIN